MSTPPKHQRALRHLAWVDAPAWIIGLVVLTIPTACTSTPERSMVVMATAYNSVESQTSEDPWVGAWGDPLRNHMKAIAVSRDLLEEGLTRGRQVRIEGLPGEYVVLDKMAQRWRKKIDIYMGDDVRAARRWGVRKVRIFWTAGPAETP